MQMKCSNYTVCNYEDSKRGLSKISAPSSESDDMRAAFGSKDEWFQNGKVPLHHVGIDGFSWTMAIAGGVSTSSVESNVAMFRRIYFAMFRLFFGFGSTFLQHPHFGYCRKHTRRYWFAGGKYNSIACDL